ncbi:MAG: hypothetical protein ACOX5M_06605 [Bacillota bacterium]|jgi:hypothetical protein
MKKADLYMNYLREEGYAPKLDGDGDVQFKFEGLTYCIFAEEDDREYFRISLPNFWPIESEEERRQVVVACNEATAGVKVGKVYPVGDNVWASLEMLIDPIEDFPKFFRRSLLILSACTMRFRESMSNRIETQ